MLTTHPTHTAEMSVKGAVTWLVETCYRPNTVRVLLLPCHIGMCIPSAGTALGIYASEAWHVTATMLLGG